MFVCICIYVYFSNNALALAISSQVMDWQTTLTTTLVNTLQNLEIVYIHINLPTYVMITVQNLYKTFIINVLLFCTAPLSLADQPEAELFPMDIDHA